MHPATHMGGVWGSWVSSGPALIVEVICVCLCMRVHPRALRMKWLSDRSSGSKLCPANVATSILLPNRTTPCQSAPQAESKSSCKTRNKTFSLESRLQLKDSSIVKHRGRWGGEKREGGKRGKWGNPKPTTLYDGKQEF